MSKSVALTRQVLNEAKDLNEMFSLEQVRNNCVSNYMKTAGVNEPAAEMYYERERVLFMKTLIANPGLNKCDRFSLYTSYVELMVSGLSLNEQLAYIIPYGEQAQFQIGWKGRLEQISQMPEVNYVPQPEIVLTHELPNFQYVLGENKRIVQHIPAGDRSFITEPTDTTQSKIEFVYCVIDTAFGKRTEIMTRQEVLDIRNRYSQKYKYYVSKGGKYPDGKAMEPPAWLTSEAEMFKKTLVKRIYKYMPKTARQKALDEKIKEYVDHEDGTTEGDYEPINYGINDDGEPVPQSDMKVTGAAKTRTTKAKADVKATANVDKETGEVNVSDLPDLGPATTGTAPNGPDVPDGPKDDAVEGLGNLSESF